MNQIARNAIDDSDARRLVDFYRFGDNNYSPIEQTGSGFGDYNIRASLKQPRRIASKRTCEGLRIHPIENTAVEKAAQKARPKRVYKRPTKTSKSSLPKFSFSKK